MDAPVSLTAKSEIACRELHNSSQEHVTSDFTAQAHPFAMPVAALDQSARDGNYRHITKMDLKKL